MVRRRYSPLVSRVDHRFDVAFSAHGSTMASLGSDKPSVICFDPVQVLRVSSLPLSTDNEVNTIRVRPPPCALQAQQWTGLIEIRPSFRDEAEIEFKSLSLLDRRIWSSSVHVCPFLRLFICLCVSIFLSAIVYCTVQ